MRTTIRLVVLSMLASLTAVITSQQSATAAWLYAADGAYLLKSGVKFADVQVHEPSGHMFASAMGDGVIVADLDGQVVAELTGIGDARELSLSNDGTKIFVAQPATNGYSTIDAQTLAVTAYDTGANSCPTSVAETSGRIWFSRCSGGFSGYNADTGVVTGTFETSSSSYILTASPQVPDALFGYTGNSVRRWTPVIGADVDTVTVAASNGLSAVAGRLDISGDGTQVITSRGVTLASDDLAVLHDYKYGGEPGSFAAFRDDGLIAVEYGRRIRVYEPGVFTPMREYKTGVRFYGIDFGTRRMYRMLLKGAGTNPDQLIITTPARATLLSIRTDKTRYKYGETVKVSVHLGSPTLSRQVIIGFVSSLGKRQRIAKGTVDAKGNLLVRATAKVNGNYTVSFRGDESYAPKSSSTPRRPVNAKVTITMAGSYGSDGKYHLYHYGDAAVVKLHVLPNHAGDCLGVSWLQWYDGNWHRNGGISCVRLNRYSRATVRLRAAETAVIGQNFQILAYFDRDKRNAVGSHHEYMRFTS